PFKMVAESNLDTIRVTITPMTTISSTEKAATTEEYLWLKNLPIKIVEMLIMIGKRPLQGTKLLVIIAISFSLGESIILVEIIPAALHPNPILIVKACFPWVPAFLKKLSRLKATLGRYPKSSNKVNNGKNIA